MYELSICSLLGIHEKALRATVPKSLDLSCNFPLLNGLEQQGISLHQSTVKINNARCCPRIANARQRPSCNFLCYSKDFCVYIKLPASLSICRNILWTYTSSAFIILLALTPEGLLCAQVSGSEIYPVRALHDPVVWCSNFSLLSTSSCLQQNGQKVKRDELLVCWMLSASCSQIQTERSWGLWWTLRLQLTWHLQVVLKSSFSC